MKKIVRKNMPAIAGAVVGATVWFFYWKFIGCSTGTCYIQFGPDRMRLYGALMGGLMLNMFKPPIIQQ